MDPACQKASPLLLVAGRRYLLSAVKILNKAKKNPACMHARDKRNDVGNYKERTVNPL
jgi:hypothetical protein